MFKLREAFRVEFIFSIRITYHHAQVKRVHYPRHPSWFQQHYLNYCLSSHIWCVLTEALTMFNNCPLMFLFYDSLIKKSVLA